MKGMMIVMTETTTYIRKGDIFYVYLGTEKNGHVQSGGLSGMRPCIIVNNDIACIYSPILLVVPITSSKNKMLKHLPTHLKLNNILQKESIAMFEQILTINRDQLSTKIGNIPAEMISKVNQKLEISFGLCA